MKLEKHLHSGSENLYYIKDIDKEGIIIAEQMSEEVAEKICFSVNTIPYFLELFENHLQILHKMIPQLNDGYKYFVKEQVELKLKK